LITNKNMVNNIANLRSFLIPKHINFKFEAPDVTKYSENHYFYSINKSNFYSQLLPSFNPNLLILCLTKLYFGQKISAFYS